MPRVIGYRVKIFNAKENIVSVPFNDLCVKFSSGYVLPLQVREGDIIPLDALDSEDVRKSLLVGSLRKYLDLGKIEPIYEAEPEPEVAPVVPQNVPTVSEPTPVVEKEAEKPVTPAEVPPPVREETASNQTPLTDLNLVKTYDDFSRLSYFLKLRFIKESDNVALLKEISARTTSAQFKNNILLRLS